jgi:hypothetical protein
LWFNAAFAASLGLRKGIEKINYPPDSNPEIKNGSLKCILLYPGHLFQIIK